MIFSGRVPVPKDILLTSLIIEMLGSSPLGIIRKGDLTYNSQ